MLAAGWILGYSGPELLLIIVLCITQTLVQMIFFFRSGFQAFQFFRIDAFASVLDRCILLAIVILLIHSGSISLESYTWAGLVSAGIAMAILYLVALRKFGWIAPEWKPVQFRKLIRDSFPFAVITVLYSVNDKVDQVMLERIHSSHEAGLYAGAYRWIDASMMYLWTVLPVFFARFSFHIHSPDKQKKLLDSGQGLTALPMIWLALSAWFVPEKFLFLFTQSTPAELEVMQKCLQILFIAVGVNGIFAIFSTLLTSTGHEKFVSWMIGISIAINVSANAIFIPHYGAISSAWATLVSYSFLSVSYMIYIHWRLPFGISWWNILKIFSCAVTGFFLMYALDQAGIEWFVFVFSAAGLMLIQAYLLKLFHWRGEA